MAGESLTSFIVLNEIANFKGTPKKFYDFEENLRTKFPDMGTKVFTRRITDALHKSRLPINSITYPGILSKAEAPDSL